MFANILKTVVLAGKYVMCQNQIVRCHRTSHALSNLAGRHLLQNRLLPIFPCAFLLSPYTRNVLCPFDMYECPLPVSVSGCLCFASSLRFRLFLSRAESLAMLKYGHLQVDLV